MRFTSEKGTSYHKRFGGRKWFWLVTAPPDVWAAMEARRNKDALFWRDKSFPYYDDLFALYDGELI